MGRSAHQLAVAVHEPFPHTWMAEVLGAPPLIAPAQHFVYPQAVPGEEETLARGALELLVRPEKGGSFLATCSLGFADPTMPTALWSTPAPDWLCALSGGYAYLLDTNHPANSVQIPLRPVVEVQAAVPQGLLLFAGFHHIVAWGEGGIVWQTGRLSWEGIRLGDIHGGQLEGWGWDMFSDRELPFTVDLRTGMHTGGGFRAPSGTSR